MRSWESARVPRYSYVTVLKHAMSDVLLCNDPVGVIYFPFLWKCFQWTHTMWSNGWMDKRQTNIRTQVSMHVPTWKDRWRCPRQCFQLDFSKWIPCHCLITEMVLLHQLLCKNLVHPKTPSECSCKFVETPRHFSEDQSLRCESFIIRVLKNHCR